MIIYPSRYDCRVESWSFDYTIDFYVDIIMKIYTDGADKVELFKI